MKELYELNSIYNSYSTKIDSIRGLFDIAKIKQEISKLEEQTQDPSFWSNRSAASKITSKLSSLQDQLDSYNKLIEKYNEIGENLQLLKLENDSMFQQETEDLLIEFKKYLTSFENEMYLSGEYDSSNAILEFHPGAGGTEAHDWALMLFRMYSRFCELHRFKMEVINYLVGEEAGISSATILVKGKNAFGLLKSERGVHRLVRISPFDSSGSRHTSFASVNVMPEFNDNIDLKIEDKDLKIDTFRSQGAGGQNVNKTESAVRITHIPTGIVAYSEVERSQIQNRELAMNLLKSRIFQKLETERQEKLREINGEKKDIEWGSQIRSYVFCPYTLVKDHRTNYEEKDVYRVMDGYLDNFIDAYLKEEFKNGNKIKK